MTATSPQLGDPKLTKVTVGSIDLLNQATVLGISIYESIFTPATIADITVFDSTDVIGKTRILSGEPVSIVFDCMIEGSPTMKLDLMLDQVADTVAEGAQKSKVYTLKCVSPEAISAKTNYVQKCYENKLCSDMVKDIVKTYLHSKKSVETESTKGTQVVLIPNMNPYHALSLVQKRSVSSTNKSSLYVFFESRQTSTQKYKFVTVESLFKGNVIKSFKQSDAINASLANRTDDNILSYRVSHHGSASFNARYARTNRREWDIRSNYEVTYVTQPKPGTTGGTSTTLSPYLDAKIKEAKHPPASVTPVDTAQRPFTRVGEATPDTFSYIATLMQNSMKIRVIGDTVLTAGSLIYCNIPEKQGSPGPSKQEPMLTGKFLISRIHHRIGGLTEQPRYTCIIECLKGQYEKG